MFCLQQIHADSKIRMVSVNIEITDKCNLHCAFCFNNSEQKHSRFLTLDEFQKFLSKLIEFGVTDVTLSGGDPFLHPQIVDIIDWSLRCHLNVLCLSNGLLIDCSVADYLVENDIMLQISLDGATEETDDKIRCVGHYSHAVALMDYLSERGYQFGRARMTICRQNIKEIDSFFDLCVKKHFVPTYSFVMRLGRANSMWESLQISPKEKARIRNRLEEKYRASGFFDLGEQYMIRTVNVKNIRPSFGCSLDMDPLTLSPLIKTDGSIQPCQLLYDDAFTIGNLNNKLIFDTERLESLRSLVAKRRRDLLDSVCCDCSFKDACGQGCPGKAYCSGNFDSVDDECDLRKIDCIQSHFLASSSYKDR